MVSIVQVHTMVYVHDHCLQPLSVSTYLYEYHIVFEGINFWNFAYSELYDIRNLKIDIQ